MSWIESKYINLLSSRLRNFKKKSGNLWNFSCPICGDSETDHRRARGYVYEIQGRLRYKCHNCDKNISAADLVKEIDEPLYLEMKKELFSEYKTLHEPDVVKFARKMKVPDEIKYTQLSELQKISQLKPNHPAKKYVESRKLPPESHHKIFYAPDFRGWTNSIIPGKFKPSPVMDQRIVFPFYTSSGRWFGYQGRSLDPNNSVRYITIILDEDVPRIYNMNSVDLNRRFYVFEGPIDSLFMPNSLASAGGNIITELKSFTSNKSNAVIVYDNEPRNKDVVKKINSAINHDYNVVIWPEYISEKDVNEMVLAGLDVDQVIKSNIVHGLTAKLKFSQWKKI